MTTLLLRSKRLERYVNPPRLEPGELYIAPPSGRLRLSLRRYSYSGEGRDCPDSVRSWGHNAERVIGTVPAGRAGDGGWGVTRREGMDWPTACEDCGAPFAPDDNWQINAHMLYYAADGSEFSWWDRPHPVGAMIRCHWLDQVFPPEPWQVFLPDGGEWITTQPASGGGAWEVSGRPPRITVSPSIFHNPPTGWHGFIRDGKLSPV